MRSRPLFRPAAILLLVLPVAQSQSSTSVGPTSMGQLANLTGRASVTVTLTGRDNFANEFRYEVRVKNQSASRFDANELVVALDQITESGRQGCAGPDRSSGTRRRNGGK